MTKSSQAGKHRGKGRAPHGASATAPRGRRGASRPLDGSRSASFAVTEDAQRYPKHPGSLAPRAEPSTNGAKQWTGGRRQVRKHR